MKLVSQITVCVVLGLVMVWRMVDLEGGAFPSAQNLPRSASEFEEDDIRHDSSEEGNEEDPSLLAPRSHDGPYNHRVAGERYMIYSPGGGFSNQRREIEYAVVIAQILNRTLYVPMCGRHTNTWRNYAKLKGASDLFPMDRILDFPFLSFPRRRLVPLNITVSELVYQKFNQTEVYRVPRFANLYERKDVAALGRIDAPLLYFRGNGFYHPWFSEATLLPVQRRTRFTQYIRQLAMELTAQSVLGGEYYAVHVRMGDYSWKHEGKDSSAIVAKLEQNCAGTSPASPYLPRELVTKFTAAFPAGRIRGDMLGILEQLVCVQATSFAGSYYSTFSKYISFTRHNLKSLFPELVDKISADDNV
ncbi:hypothetical protein BASA81_001891 [Batrachochytrium salamandrivorans]|nr:hypothetical protein BASA81_001891 [Batrachochytrium salamandrivorans]